MPPLTVQTPLASACHTRDISAGEKRGDPPTYVEYLPNNCCSFGSENLLSRYLFKVKNGIRAVIILGFLQISFKISNAAGEELFIIGFSKQSNIFSVELKNLMNCSPALDPNILLTSLNASSLFANRSNSVPSDHQCRAKIFCSFNSRCSKMFSPTSSKRFWKMESIVKTVGPIFTGPLEQSSVRIFPPG